MTDVGNLHAKRKLVVGDAEFLSRDPPNQSRSHFWGDFAGRECVGRSH